MNKLSTIKREQVLRMLVEGSSMRSIARVQKVSFNTVAKLLIDEAKACDAYQNEHIRDVPAKHVQCDEIWSFVYAKDKNVSRAVAAPDGAGDIWTWTAIDVDSELIISWLMGDGDASFGIEFMDDLRSRTADRFQLTTDGHGAYLEAVEGAFGGDVDYAQLVKLYGRTSEEEQRRYSPSKCIGTRKRVIAGRPEMADVSTSYVERHNLTMRMSMRRFTRLTNAFSKKAENHYYSMALYLGYYNWIRTHKTLGTTPAVAAGLTDRPYTMEWIVGLIDAREAKPKRGPYKKDRFKLMHYPIMGLLDALS